MKYLIWSLMALLLLSCASKQKAGEGAAASDATDAKSSTTKKSDGKTSTESGTTSASGDAIQCTWKTETRKIENNKTGTGCEVIYTKNGNAESVGSATSDLSTCENIAKRIQGNLESNGFKCNAI